MKKNRQNMLSMVILVLVGLTLLVGYSPAVAAGLTPQEISGTVEFAMSSELPWNPLTMETTLQAGNLIRTGMDGKVTLGSEDGSTLKLTNDTQLAIVELTFSKSQKNRIYRFSLLKGTVTANVKDLDFKAENNVFEIGTEVVIARAQGTEMQMTYDVTVPLCNVFNLGGEVFFQQIAAGVSNFAGLFGEDSDDDQKEGLTFSVNTKGAEIYMNVQVEEHTIIVRGNVPLPEIIAMLGNYIAMQVTNLDDTGKAAIIVLMPDGKNKAELVEEDDKALVATDPANVIFVTAPSFLSGKFQFFKEFGTTGFIWIWCDCGKFFEPILPPPPAPVPTIPPIRTPPTGSPVRP